MYLELQPVVQTPGQYKKVQMHSAVFFFKGLIKVFRTTACCADLRGDTKGSRDTMLWYLLRDY